MGVGIKRKDYASHEEFVTALAVSLANDVRQISARTGIRPQYVVNRMAAVMFRKAGKQ